MADNCSATTFLNNVYNTKTKAKYLGPNKLLTSQTYWFITKIVVVFLKNYSFLASNSYTCGINQPHFLFSFNFLNLLLLHCQTRKFFNEQVQQGVPHSPILLRVIFQRRQKDGCSYGNFWPKTAIKTAKNAFLTIFFHTKSSPISVFWSEMFGMENLFILKTFFPPNSSATHIFPYWWNVLYSFCKEVSNQCTVYIRVGWKKEKWHFEMWIIMVIYIPNKDQLKKNEFSKF